MTEQIAKGTDVGIEQPDGRANAVKSLPESLHDTYQGLYETFRGMTEHLLEKYYKVGQLVKKGYEDFAAARKKEGKSRYGANVAKQLADALQVDARILLNCLKVVRTYNRDEYARLAAQKGLTWSHIVHLAGVRDARERANLQRIAVERSLSAKALDAEIKERLGNRRPGSGRRPAAPRNVMEALQRVNAASATYCGALRNAISGDRFTLKNALTEMSPEEMTPELREEFLRAVDALEQGGVTSADYGKTLCECLQWVEDSLPAPQQAEAEGAKQEMASAT